MASQVIDEPLEAWWQEQAITPNTPCDDATFLRRITLDLAGRIPTAGELDAYLADPDKEALIDRLLEAESFALHWADLWTTMLIGYGDAFETDRESLRLWLVDQFRKNRSYDSIVASLVTATGASTTNGAVNFLARYPDEAEVKVSRLFLGVQIDCARCHDHPYDRWTEDDFANFSRFFDSMELAERGEGNIEITNELLEGNKPKFLTGATPRTRMWRDELALYMQHTNAFSKNFVNRIWYQLMGRGIVHEPDNFNAENPPSVSPLLDSLTEFGREVEWNFKQVIREICLSKAYRISSVCVDDNQLNRVSSFAVRSIKPLTPEQWYRSVSAIAGGEVSMSQEEFFEHQIRDDEDFSQTWKYRETVQQMMMQLSMDLPLRFSSLEQVYQTILSREMTPRDRQLCSDNSISDVAFALLNSSEFFFNH